jgi:type III restriction enzyme
MATGTGKTVIMAMLIAWHTLNKLANRQDSRFSDAFLLVAPGITIRDRLRAAEPGGRRWSCGLWILDKAQPW